MENLMLSLEMSQLKRIMECIMKKTLEKNPSKVKWKSSNGKRNPKGRPSLTMMKNLMVSLMETDSHFIEKVLTRDEK
jgi:hypothetical protein